MSRLRLLLHGRYSAPGSGTYTPPVGALRMGINQTTQSWDEWARQDRFQADIWTAYNSTSGQQVGIPAANLDADRWPKSVPSGCSYVQRVVAHKPAASPSMVYQMTWTGNFGGSGPLSNSSTTISNYDPVNRTCDVTEIGTIPSGSIWYATAPAILQYTIDSADTTAGTYPKNIKVFPKGEASTGFDPAVKADTQAITTGPIRFMKDTGVERNDGVHAGKSYGDAEDFSAPWGGGTQSSPAYLVTMSNRTTYAGGEWYYNVATYGASAINTPINSGMPIEAAVEMCNDYNRDLWWCEHWNADPAVWEYNAAYIRDHLSTSLKAYIEMSNEVWNFGYPVCGQASLEAKAANRTDGHDLSSDISYISGDRAARLAEKCIELFGHYSTVWAAVGGSKPTLKRTVAWWHAGGGAGVAAALLDYQPPTAAGPLKNYCDVYATAPYYSQRDVDPLTANYNSALGGSQRLLDGLWAGVDHVTETAEQIRAVCDARSLEYATYEMGPDLIIDNNNSTNKALAETIQRGAEMGKTVSYFLQRLEAASPGSAACYFTNSGFIASNGAGGWGAKEYLLQPEAETPKWSAIRDYVSGQRKLVTLHGTLLARTGAQVDEVVGYVRRRMVGSTVTVNSPFKIVDSTAKILQIAVANATSFASAGSVTCDIDETGGNPSSTLRTSLACTVTSDAFLSPNQSTRHWDILSGTEAWRIEGAATGNNWGYTGASIARSNGYVEFTIGDGDNSMYVGFYGTGFTGANGLWQDSKGIGYSGSFGGLWVNGSKVANWPTYTNGDTIDLFISTGGKIYCRKNNGSWIGADGAGSVNPATDTGGYDISAFLTAVGGTCRPAADTKLPGHRFSIRFKDADFIHTKPSGASAWV